MAKQTAVEWLVEQLMERDFIKKNFEIIEQAKEMEKDQIIESSRISYLAGQEYYTLNGLSKKFAIEYYNKTYTK